MEKINNDELENKVLEIGKSIKSGQAYQNRSWKENVR